MNLFQTGDFTLASGAKSRWKIECDALTREDWKGLAAIAAEILPPFGWVQGVPKGGFPFADALRSYAMGSPFPLLIAEDVVTTGGSMERFREGFHPDAGDIIGVCVFARGPCPSWVTPLFQMTKETP